MQIKYLIFSIGLVISAPSTSGNGYVQQSENVALASDADSINKLSAEIASQSDMAAFTSDDDERHARSFWGEQSYDPDYGSKEPFFSKKRSIK
ncbi:hypothetical protein DSO57_1016046 [Entomophthora muscae]|uniref:Uncharacterized protein n=1 Tax=Entomophthora muscae TaxID=34485 RepID=A0ACC2UPS8_9FUNG|nr:hypothetical protein DSO57_1016046 [Entomophthora muscae]